MRKINTTRTQRATRHTARTVNRSLLLSLLREQQPLSRAELARRMKANRAMVGTLVKELLEEGVIYESPAVAATRGRPPTMLHVRSHDRLVVGIDVRFSRSFVRLSDFNGNQIATETLPTPLDPELLADALAHRVQGLLRAHGGFGEVEGIGLVVPGMVDRRDGRIVRSPSLGWTDVPLREMLSRRTGARVLIENAPAACALAQSWLGPKGGEGVDDFAYVTVSDGVGVGVVVDGALLRGHSDLAGEFGHLPLNMDGPRCMCGLRGCLEAYTSNLATIGRYLRLDPTRAEHLAGVRQSGLQVKDLVSRAGAGDVRARQTLLESGRYLGVGLAGIVTALNPARIFLSGEILAAWELIGEAVVGAMRERVLTPAGAATPITVVPDARETRLRGAVALLVARDFAAPDLV